MTIAKKPDGIRRLERLADYLGTVPAEVFNLEDWECGAVFCAIGHACQIPEFQAEGLKLRYLEMDSDGVKHPFFRDKISWEAVKAFFEISATVAVPLFSSSYYQNVDQTTPAEVAAKIHKYLKSGEL